MKKRINYYFLLLAAALVTLGMLFLSTLSTPLSLRYFGNSTYYLFHQLIALAIGLALAAIAFKTPLYIIKKITFWLFLSNLALLIIVFLPKLGAEFWGARRWIGIGKSTIQPSEFLKLTSILYLSAWLSTRFSETSKKGWISFVKRNIQNFTQVFLPFLIFLGIISVILILQPDMSTLGIIALTLIVVYFSAGTPFWHSASVVLAGLALLAALIASEPYRLQRFFVFLNPGADPLGAGFQPSQSLIALGSGGIFGKGLGLSTQKFGFLPQAMSDSVFAVIGEEAGIIGAVILILLFVAFTWLGIKIAKSSSDKFASLAVVGITFWIALQAFVNIASAVVIFPLAGIPLPFFSYGGSHLIVELIGVGLILNISKNS